MSGVAVVRQGGPQTYTPASGQIIHGGLLVEASSTTPGRIELASAGSSVVLGVALTDAIAPEQQTTTTTTDTLGRPVLTAVRVPTTVAVANSGAEVKVTYSAAATLGQPLVSTGAGQVGPAGANPTAGTIVGKCTEPLGVAAAGVGRARIY